ncbi:MAG: hypothetical protein CMA65_05630 [Euryarchaeota archaeon]|nr:hypothetical protein [Euryarchaeota archaeon]
MSRLLNHTGITIDIAKIGYGDITHHCRTRHNVIVLRIKASTKKRNFTALVSFIGCVLGLSLGMQCRALSLAKRRVEGMQDARLNGHYTCWQAVETTGKIMLSLE